MKKLVTPSEEAIGGFPRKIGNEGKPPSTDNLLGNVTKTEFGRNRHAESFSGPFKTLSPPAPAIILG